MKTLLGISLIGLLSVAVSVSALAASQDDLGRNFKVPAMRSERIQASQFKAHQGALAIGSERKTIAPTIKSLIATPKLTMPKVQTLDKTAIVGPTTTTKLAVPRGLLKTGTATPKTLERNQLLLKQEVVTDADQLPQVKSRTKATVATAVKK